MFGTFVNFSPYMVKGNFKFRIFTEKEGKEEYLMSLDASIPSPQMEFYPPTYETMIECSIPASLPDGVYHVYPAFGFDGEEHVFTPTPGYPDYVIFTREGGVNKAELHETSSLEVENLSSNGDIYFGKRFRVTGTAKFVGGVGDTERYVGVRLLDSNGNICGYSTELNLKFSDTGNDFDFVSAWFSQTGSGIAPGQYTLALQIGFETIATCPVTITDATADGEYEVTGVTVENASGVDPTNINIVATVKGISGLVDENMTFIISRGITQDSSTDVPVFVTEGRTGTVNYTASLRIPMTGYTYSVTCGKRANGKWVGKTAKAYFYVADQSGITDVEPDSDVPAEYFNLQGMPVDGDNLVPGVYICRQGSKVSKILVK